MKVTHIKSTDRAKWQVGEIGNECYADTIKLTGVKKQTLKGFGGCFNELGWEALSKLSEKGRNTYFGELFGEENCGFNNGRVPIGANDLSVSWYSCDETDGDFELKDFNIERDKQRTIPFVKEALKRQPDMTVFASPWSPPTWMKTRKVFNFGTLRQEEPYQLAYAKYLLKFVDAYKDAGIAIKQLHVQNEVFADQKFASCLWTAEEMRDFMKNYLGPEAEKQGKLQDLELWLGTINGPFVDIRIGAMYGSPLSQFYDQFENTILSDSNAAKYITGVAFQWGGKHVIEETELSYPEFRYMMSESECGGGDNSWEDAEYIFRQMWHYFRHGAESYIYWNLAMPEDNSSTWGWRQNALATVTDDGTLNWNPEFFLMKHLSHFAKPGARYLETAGHLAANTIAFENPDGTVALIVGSNMQTERAFTFEYQGNHFSAIIEPHSIHSFLIGD